MKVFQVRHVGFAAPMNSVSHRYDSYVSRQPWLGLPDERALLMAGAAELVPQGGTEDPDEGMISGVMGRQTISKAKDLLTGREQSASGWARHLARESAMTAPGVPAGGCRLGPRHSLLGHPHVW